MTVSVPDPYHITKLPTLKELMLAKFVCSSEALIRVVYVFHILTTTLHARTLRQNINRPVELVRKAYTLFFTRY